MFFGELWCWRYQVFGFCISYLVLIAEVELMIWKEVVVTFFEVLSQHSLQKTEESDICTISMVTVGVPVTIRTEDLSDTNRELILLLC